MPSVRLSWLVWLASGLLLARTTSGKSLYRKPHKITETDHRNHTFSLWKAKSREHQFKHSASHSGDRRDHSAAANAAEDGESSNPPSTRMRPGPAASSEASNLLATRAKARAHSERLRAATASNKTGHQIVLRADNTPTSALRAAVNQRHNRQRAGQAGSSPLSKYSFRDAPPLQAVPPPQPLTELGEHALVFVGGMPQSGTSLARELLLTPSSSGMDSCMKSTRCSLTNVEGQWLLGDDSDHKGRLRAMYGAGDIMASHHLTEHNHTKLEHADMREYLWRSWSPFWDMQRPVLVEKSPPNFLKVRWLAEVFSPTKQVKFVLVVKNPVANAHFERPQKCWDVTALPCQDYFAALAASAAAPAITIHSDGGGDGADAATAAASRLPVLSSTPPLKQCPASHALCQGQRGNRLWARYMYARQWVEDHERLVRDLQAWDEGEKQQQGEDPVVESSNESGTMTVASMRRNLFEAAVLSDLTSRRMAHYKEAAPEGVVDDAHHSSSHSSTTFNGQGSSDYEVDRSDRSGAVISSKRRNLLSRKFNSDAATTAVAGMNGVRSVLVVRYEQFAEGCTCEGILRFAFSEDASSTSRFSLNRHQAQEGGARENHDHASSLALKRLNGPLLIPESDIAAACQRAPTCSTKDSVKTRSKSRNGPKSVSSSRDSKDRSSSVPDIGEGTSPNIISEANGNSIGKNHPMDRGEPLMSSDRSTDSESQRQRRRRSLTSRQQVKKVWSTHSSRSPTEPQFEVGNQKQQQQQEWRRLSYEGNGGGGGGKPATVHKDKSSAPRYAFWQQQLDLTKGWPDGCLDAFKALEPRARTLGYSLLEPGVHTYKSPGDERTDAFAPWALSEISI